MNTIAEIAECATNIISNPSGNCEEKKGNAKKRMERSRSDWHRSWRDGEKNAFVVEYQRNGDGWGWKKEQTTIMIKGNILEHVIKQRALRVCC